MIMNYLDPWGRGLVQVLDGNLLRSSLDSETLVLAFIPLPTYYRGLDN